MSGGFIFLMLVVIGIGIYAAVTGVVRIGEDEVGLVFKKAALQSFLRSTPSPGLIRLNGEAGWQADTLPAGIHLWRWRWMYDIRKVPLVRIPAGEIGLVVADVNYSLGISTFTV